MAPTAAMLQLQCFPSSLFGCVYIRIHTSRGFNTYSAKPSWPQKSHNFTAFVKCL